MFALQVFVRRNRRLLLRLGALLVVGAGGLVALLPLPGNDAHAAPATGDPNVALSAPVRLLLAPEPLPERGFLDRYGIVYP